MMGTTETSVAEKILYCGLRNARDSWGKFCYFRIFFDLKFSPGDYFASVKKV